MPRILTPRRDSTRSLPRRRGSSNLSLHGSRSSLNSYRRSMAANANVNGSQFSLKRSSLRRTESSSHSLTLRGLCQHQGATQKKSMQNDLWYTEEPISDTKSPSLTSSETSSISSQSSSHQHSSDTRMSLHQYCNAVQQHKGFATMFLQEQEQQQTMHNATTHLLTTAQQSQHRRASLQYVSRNLTAMQSLRRSSMPQTHIEEDETWGQFANVSESEDISSRIDLLSIKGAQSYNSVSYRLRRN